MKTHKTNNLTSERKVYGFTLVELIVVITILVILGTIAFLSFQGYSASARDSSRISDLSNITKALDLTKVKTGYYPDPSSSTGVTFSGGIVWSQGTIGDSVVRIANSAGFGLSKIPTDPLFANIEYTYSLTSNKREYQLGTIMENSNTAYNPVIDTLITDAYAAGPVTAYVQGNYNGVMSQVKTDSNEVCILAIPNIILHDISSDSGTVLNSGDPIQANNLVFNKRGNLPSSYTTNTEISASNDIFSFIPLASGDDMTIGGAGITVYCSGSLPSSGEEVTTVLTNLSLTYDSANLTTDVVSTPQIASLLSSTTDESTKLSSVATVLSSSLGGTLVDVKLAAGGGGGCNYNQSNINALNNLGSNGDLEVSDIDGNSLSFPLTKNQWCAIYELDWYGGSPVASEIFTLNKLPTLYLGNNNITNLSSQIGNMTNLTTLGLDNNPLIFLPSQLGNLTKLTNLDLNSNSFTSLPSPIASMTNLVSLNLSNNSFTTFPSQLWNLPNLTDLKFVSNFLTTLTIPNTVTSIGEQAFSSNLLTSVTISNSVTSIGDWAFYNNQISTVTLPNNITSIGNKVFYKNNLTTVTIPDSVTSIGEQAFSSNLLTSVVIGNSVTSIGTDAFQGNALLSITIPNSVTSIGAWAFDYNQLTTIIIPNNVTSIGDFAFYRNSLTSITIPSSVTSIGADAFFNQINSSGNGYIYGPNTGYIFDTYTNNSNDEFDKTKLPHYTGS